MISINDYDIFIKNITTLKEASKDDSVPNDPQFMTESTLQVIGFDGVKTQYLNNLRKSENLAKSVDVLFVSETQIYLIEFKNGNMNNEKNNMKLKIRDSLLLFCDITKKNIEDTRKHLHFILVYNESKNCSSQHDIVKYLSERAELPSVRFSLDCYEDLYFNSVNTYTETEFERFFVSHIT